MRQYKRIGILGGISPQSSALFYKKIIEKHYQKYKDHYYPEIVMFSVDFGKLKDYQNNPDQTDYINELVKGISILERAGADFAVIASNTPHRVFSEIEKRTSIQLLSIVDSTANYAIKNGYKKLLLLGTAYTMKEEFYKNGLKAQNIHAVVPSEAEQEMINNIIFNELILGDVENQSKNAVLGIINKHSVDAVILGCTELSLLITDRDTDIPLIDTTDVHAEATLNFAIC
ncbi:MAG: amino acid racemase [Bacteroidales bacterium]|nr:amino acid racemase [Bacteroidales bacterium]